MAEVAPGMLGIGGLSHHVALGDAVRLETGAAAEVIRIDDTRVTAKPFDSGRPVALGTRVRRIGPLVINPAEGWRGRVVNALGEPVDGAGPLTSGNQARPTVAPPPPPLDRQRVGQPMQTGVRAIDLFTPLCFGQRIGIFAGSGVGKSTLLAMLAQAQGFDTVVIALVGERGREVREFLEETLGEHRKRAILVVATGDESPMMRRQAPLTAMTIAETFRDRGDQVLLVLDSMTRFAHAQRDIALGAGEPPVARGYPPSVFSDLPRLLERAGPGGPEAGSITGVFSVLVDGDDQHDPVADTIRGTLDGHIVLDRAIAERGRYPAVDVLASISRLAPSIWTADQRALVLRTRALIARFEETRDLRLMGGYRPGSDPELDRAVRLVPLIEDALEQAPDTPPSTDAFRELAEVLQSGLQSEQG